MQRFFSLTALLSFGLLCGCQSPPTTVVIRAGRMLDGTGANVQHNMRVTVHEGTIVSVEPDSDALLPKDALSIDARNHTLMPGLIDTHVNVVGSSIFETARNLKSLMAMGVTTAVDLDTPLVAIVAVRAFVGTARHRGPRLMVAGSTIARLESVQAARTAAQALAAMDVDLVAVGDKLAPALLCTVIEEAHRHHLKVVSTYAAFLEHCPLDAQMHERAEPISKQLEGIVDGGLSAHDALQIVTAKRAQLLGLQDALARIAVGYRADLITVEGRPDFDVGDIQKVRDVMIDGIVQNTSSPTMLDTALLGLEIAWTHLEHVGASLL